MLTSDIILRFQYSSLQGIMVGKFDKFCPFYSFREMIIIIGLNHFFCPNLSYMQQLVQTHAGLLMEEEVPTALILLRSISQRSFKETYPELSYTRFAFSCMLRLILGYLFLVNLLITTIQASDVITIFFDILALQFVQQLDDVAFELGRKDILGRHLSAACAIEYRVLTADAYKRRMAEIESSHSGNRTSQDRRNEEGSRMCCGSSGKGFGRALKVRQIYST